MHETQDECVFYSITPSRKWLSVVVSVSVIFAFGIFFNGFCANYEIWYIWFLLVSVMNFYCSTFEKFYSKGFLFDFVSRYLRIFMEFWKIFSMYLGFILELRYMKQQNFDKGVWKFGLSQRQILLKKKKRIKQSKKNSWIFIV